MFNSIFFYQGTTTHKYKRIVQCTDHSLDMLAAWCNELVEDGAVLYLSKGAYSRVHARVKQLSKCNTKSSKAKVRARDPSNLSP